MMVTFMPTKQCKNCGADSETVKALGVLWIVQCTKCSTKTATQYFQADAVGAWNNDIVQEIK